MVKRQLLWNARSYDDSDPARHEFLFVLVNQHRELWDIRQRALEVLRPTENIMEDEKLIENSGGLHWMLLTLDSYGIIRPDNFNPYLIYPSRDEKAVRRDRKLGTHNTREGLLNYVDNLFKIKP